MLAKDDYWVVVYKLLSYYYFSMKNGEPIDENKISAQQLGINNPYLLDIYRNLFMDGYLTGSTVTSDITGNSYVNDIQSVRITSKGIEYLQDNHKMKQVYNILKEVKDWIPFI